MIQIPECHRCGEPCLQVYALQANQSTHRVEFSKLRAGARDADPRIIWLCADCVDEIAEAMA